MLLPPHTPGLRIGVYGGSFNPAHAGHRHVSVQALQKLRLDRIWWVVTPGNPLKSSGGLAPLAERMALANRIASHPRIAVTGFEEAIGARYTLDTLAYLTARARGARLVWIMGADNLAQFHRWRGWRRIAELMPFAVVDRPGWTLKAAASPAAHALAPWRIDETDAALLPDLAPPVWVFLHGPRSNLSSTGIRRAQDELRRRASVEKAGTPTLS